MRTFPMKPNVIEAGAEISPCGRYRYVLTRKWAEDGPLHVWIGLNPSTATEEVDDPTIRRCVDFSERWGAGEIAMVNLFALRSTDPRELRRAEDPIGPKNEDRLGVWCQKGCQKAGKIIAAWGNHGDLHDRGRQVSRRMDSLWLKNNGVFCLGQNRGGQPVHPLYQPLNRELRRFVNLEGAI